MSLSWGPNGVEVVTVCGKDCISVDGVCVHECQSEVAYQNERTARFAQIGRGELKAYLSDSKPHPANSDLLRPVRIDEDDLLEACLDALQEMETTGRLETDCPICHSSPASLHAGTMAVLIALAVIFAGAIGFGLGVWWLHTRLGGIG